jgi:hypothetical protein
VGDIHSRDDLLREMAACIEADMKARSFDHAVTVFLGDYIDRGFGSMRVIERLTQSEWPTPMIVLAAIMRIFWALEHLDLPSKIVLFLLRLKA